MQQWSITWRQVIGPDVKHVLKVSLDDTRHDCYTIGNYNLEIDIYIPDKGQEISDSAFRYDYGKFYALKTFFDRVKKRRILWGWINESSSVDDDVKKGWAGVQVIQSRTIPAALSLGVPTSKAFHFILGTFCRQSQGLFGWTNRGNSWCNNP